MIQMNVRAKLSATKHLFVLCESKIHYSTNHYNTNQNLNADALTVIGNVSSLFYDVSMPF